MLKYRELVNPAFRRDKANRARFIRILKMDSGITHTIRLMHQMGILARYLPVFRKIVGQMQHDLFHIYTVDQHILMVVRNLRRFTMDEYIPQHELPNQVMAEFGQPWLMYIAGLFHDIAKGRGGDHSKLGMVEVARCVHCIRDGEWPQRAHDVEELEKLILEEAEAKLDAATRKMRHKLAQMNEAQKLIDRAARIRQIDALKQGEIPSPWDDNPEKNDDPELG